MKKKNLKELIHLARGFVAAVDTGKPRVLVLAQEKRAAERELRASGHSRAEAVALIAKRYCARQNDVAQ